MEATQPETPNHSNNANAQLDEQEAWGVRSLTADTHIQQNVAPLAEGHNPHSLNPAAASSETPGPSQSDIRSNIRNDLQAGNLDIPPFKGVSASIQSRPDHRSPALLGLNVEPRFQWRLNRSVLLPDSDLPLSSQILAYAQSWGSWAQDIPDEQLRERMLDRIFEMATNAWYEALRIGYKVGVPESRPATSKTSRKRAKLPEDDLPAGLRGRPTKRERSLTKLPILTASHKSGLAWAVTAGEIEAAEISENQIRRRAAYDVNLEEAGNGLLATILELYNGRITERDWYNTEEKTKLNPLGRDLQVYCLYEVLRSRGAIEQLKSYFAGFKTDKQRENTQKRIDEEKERRDLFMALALELDEDTPPLSLPISPSGSREGSLNNVQLSTIDPVKKLTQIEQVLRSIDIILEETESTYLLSIFDLHEISDDDLTTEMSFGNASSHLEQCKYTLKEILSYARELNTLSDNVIVAFNLDTNVDMVAWTLDLEQKILDRKETLRHLLPLLTMERDVAKKGAEKANSTADKQDTPTQLPPPTIDVPMTASPEPNFTTTPKRPLQEDDLGTPTDTLAPAVDDVPMTELPASTPALPPNHTLEEDEPRAPAETLVPPVNDVLVTSELSLTATPKRPLEDDDNKGVPEMPKLKKQKTEDHGQEPKSEIPIQTIDAVLEKPDPSLRVTLRLLSPFDPTQLSTRRIFHERGFSYRYTPMSTLAQRRSFRPILDNYIKQHCNHLSRFGTTAALGFPDSPSGLEIVSGVWDLQDGSCVLDEEATAVNRDETEQDQDQDQDPAALADRDATNSGQNKKDKATTAGPSDIRNYDTVRKIPKKAVRLKLNLPAPKRSNTASSTFTSTASNKPISKMRPKRQTAGKKRTRNTDEDPDDDDYVP